MSLSFSLLLSEAGIENVSLERVGVMLRVSEENFDVSLMADSFLDKPSPPGDLLTAVTFDCRFLAKQFV